MPRGALVAGALILLTGATQAPDERAAARAFADAGLRYQAAIEALEPQLDALIERPERRCAERARRRSAEHRWDEINGLGSFQDEQRPTARLVEPAVTRLSLELHAVETADPALRGGRTAVRRLRRTNAAVAALPPVNVCAEVRRLVASGFEPTPAIRRMRRATAAFERVVAGDDTERRVDRMVSRMQELGVPASELGIWG
jgi:hypothetical protein